MERAELDQDATKYLTDWLTNDYRFAHEAGTLLDYSQGPADRERVEAELDRFCFLLVWELRSTVAGRNVLSTDKRWELTQLRHRLPQEVFRRIDWSDVREQLEDFQFPRELPEHVKKMQR